MKKILTSIVAAISLPALGQQIVYEDNYIDVIPRQFTTDGKPILHFADNNGECPVITLYNDDIEKINEIQLKEHSFDYTLTYRDETREVKDITKTELYKEHYRDLNDSYTFDDFLNEQLLFGHQEVRIENGDTIIFSMQEGSSIITRMYATYDQMFFGFSHFGNKYPFNYLLCKNNIIYRVRAEYTVTYTDWVSAGERTEQYSTETPIVKLSYNNMDEIGDETDFILSQTLFNDDDKFEYIIPKATLTDVCPLSEMRPSSNTLVLTRSTPLSDYTYPAFHGIQIVSSDGTILHDIDFGNEFEMNEYSAEWMSIITIGGKTYLLAQGYTKEEEGRKNCCMFYRIDKQTSSLYQATAAPISMNIQQKSSTINVQLSNTSEASQIIISNAVGATIANQYVPAGESKAALKAKISQGIYNITRLQNGKNIENQKFLVK